jgi:hypothetical protein
MGALIVLSCHANTLTCTNASLLEVQGRVNDANPGDTVSVPTGTATWSTYLSARKNINIIGSGTNSTIITCTTSAADIGANSAGLLRLSGFKFVGPGTTTYHGITIGAANSCRVRVDHCWIENFYFAFYSWAVGLVDHCTVVQCGRFARTSCPSYGENPSDAEMAYARNNWVPVVFNSTNAMFYESCVGAWSSFNNNYNILFTAQEAGGYVVRNCSFTFNFTGSSQQFFDFHGNQGDTNSAGSMRGTCAIGIYSNTFACSGTPSSIQLAYIRAGSGMFFSNNITGSGASSATIDFNEEDYNGQCYNPGVQGWTPISVAQDNITNVWVFWNVINGSTISPGFYNDGCANGYGTSYDLNVAHYYNGVWWTNKPPSVIVTAPFPHPLEGSSPPSLLKVKTMVITK